MYKLQVIRDAAVHGAAVLGVPVKATIKEVHLSSLILFLVSVIRQFEVCTVLRRIRRTLIWCT